MCWQVYVLTKHINEFTYRLYSVRILPAPQRWSNPVSFPLQGRCVISCSSTRTGSKHAACSSSLVRKGNNRENNSENSSWWHSFLMQQCFSSQPSSYTFKCHLWVFYLWRQQFAECLKDLAKKKKRLRHVQRLVLFSIRSPNRRGALENKRDNCNHGKQENTDDQTIRKAEMRDQQRETEDWASWSSHSLLKWMLKAGLC